MCHAHPKFQFTRLKLPFDLLRIVSAAPSASPVMSPSKLLARMEPEKRAELVARACDANNNLTTALNNLLTNVSLWVPLPLLFCLFQSKQSRDEQTKLNARTSITQIIPQLGPTLDGLNGSANSLGQAIPILGELINFLNMACLGTGI